MGDVRTVAPTVALVLALVVSAMAVGVTAVGAEEENHPPVAYFGYAPEQPSPGDEVVFGARESGDEDGEVVRYAWDLDGDGTVDATGVEVGFVYEEPGTYEVTLTVTDDDGATATKTRRVEVAENRAPKAYVLYEPEHPSVGDGVLFSARESHDPDGEIVAYRWDLDGDGEADEDGPKVDRRFETAGRHVVALTVEDDDGATHTAEVVVEVAESGADEAHEEKERPDAVHVGLGSTEVASGGTGAVPIVVEGLPAGFDAATLTVRVDHPEVGHVAAVEPADGVELRRHETDDRGLTVTLTDAANRFEAAQSRLVLGEVVLAGVAPGRSTISVEVRELRTDDGHARDVKTFAGKLHVGEGREERRLSRVVVVLDGAPDGLRRFGLTVRAPEGAVIKRVTPELLGGDAVLTVEGGAGHAAVRLRGVDFGDAVGAFEGERALVVLEVAGPVEPDAVSVEVHTLVDDRGEPMDDHRVRLRVGSATPFDEPLPGTLARGPPRDLDGDGRYEDVDGDGRVGLRDAIALAFAARDRLRDDQVGALDFDGDGRFSFGDAFALFRETTGGR